MLTKLAPQIKRKLNMAEHVSFMFRVFSVDKTKIRQFCSTIKIKLFLKCEIGLETFSRIIRKVV